MASPLLPESVAQMVADNRDDVFLIMKRDLYYRPNAQGYTGIKDHAGRYTLEQVAAMFPNMDSPHQDGTEFIRECDAQEYTKACYHDLKEAHQAQRLATLAAENAMLRAERDAALARAEKAETERDAHEASAVEAHRIKREHQSDALLWQYSAAAGNVPPLLMKIWKQRKAEMERAKRLEDALQEGRRAIGDHYAPHDCYATGPLTGDTFRDLVQCPACSFIAMHDAALTPTADKEPKT